MRSISSIFIPDKLCYISQTIGLENRPKPAQNGDADEWLFMYIVHILFLNFGLLWKWPEPFDADWKSVKHLLMPFKVLLLF